MESLRRLLLVVQQILDRRPIGVERSTNGTNDEIEVAITVDITECRGVIPTRTHRFGLRERDGLASEHWAFTRAGVLDEQQTLFEEITPEEILIAILMVVLTSLSDSFFTLRNLLNILNQNAPLAIMAAAMTLVVIAGGFDLSVAAIFAMGSVSSAWIAVNVDPYLGLLLAPFIGLAFGIVNGIVITGLNVHSFLATIATSLIFKGVAVVISDGRLISARLDEFIWLGRERFSVSSFPSGSW